MRTCPPPVANLSGTLAPRLSAVAVALAALLVAASCTSSAPSITPGGSTTPTSGPTGDGATINHAQGPTDVVFRYEVGGGFVPIDFFATQAPQFTLYGDGTVIFRDNSLPIPAQQNPNIATLAPFQTARLGEPAMQSFLRFALADSGLGVARASYRPGNVADAPTTTFTINAGGLTKTVSVEALGFDLPNSPDAPILKALARLGEQVGSFGKAVDGETTWNPTRWRGILTESQGNGAIAWPWKDITPAEFVQRADPNAPRFPIRTMTPAEIQVLGLGGIDGGFSGLRLIGPDGKTYTFSLRPLFPDENF